MDEIVKCRFIEYKLLEKEKLCELESLFRLYPSGKLLIYKDVGGCLDVVCEVKTNYSEPLEIAADLSNIKLPESNSKYDCICVLPKEGNELALDRVKCVVHSFDYFRKNSKNIKTKVIEEYDEISSSYYYLIWNDKCSDEDKDTGDKYMKEMTELLMKESIETQIKFWCDNTTFNQFRLAIETRVKGQANLGLVLVNIYQYLKNIGDNQSLCQVNMILAGPSGCGKTETVRALRDYFSKYIPKLPVSLVDMNMITTEGFKGEDTKYLVTDLFEKDSGGIGIVFLDEFDKRLTPCHSGHGDNVNVDIQHQILEAIEGYVFQEKITTGFFTENREVDTSKTMFIGMGSFDVVREMKRNAATKKVFGFGNERDEQDNDHFEEITREDIINIGACYELIGRFGQVVNYGRLSYEALDEIIALRVDEVSKMLGIKVSVSKKMKSFLHENSNTEFGNRLLLSLIQEAAYKALLEILSNEIDAAEIVITDKSKFKIIGNKQKEARV